jgi:hypothetical protein
VKRPKLASIGILVALSREASITGGVAKKQFGLCTSRLLKLSLLWGNASCQASTGLAVVFDASLLGQAVPSTP